MKKIKSTYIIFFNKQYTKINRKIQKEEDIMIIFILFLQLHIYGAKGYNLLRNFLPSPSENTLKDWFSPSNNSLLQKEFDLNMIEDILLTFIPKVYFSQGFNATMVADAYKFKEIIGQKLKELFPECLKKFNL